MKDNHNSSLQETWEAAAPGWAKWEKEFSETFVPATEKLLDMADVSSQMRVLDLACGAGAQTLIAAKRVGEGGSIVASDISEKMLKHLRQNAEQAGFNNIETLRSAAEEITGVERSFDAAISRFGLMLFPAPQSALSAVRSALKPGARFAALVFSTPDKNPFFAQAMATLLRHGGKQPPKPGQPGLFALGGPGVMEGLLGKSGFVDVQLAKGSAPFRLASADDALSFLQQAAGAYRAAIADASDEVKVAAWAEVRDFVGQFENDVGFETELEYIVGSGATQA